MPGRSRHDARWTLRGPEDVPGLRRHLRALLTDLDADSAIDAELVLDSLASRACRLGRSPCHVTVSDTAGGSLRIELDQPRSRWPDEPRHGARIGLLGKIADSWGVAHHDDYTRTWAEIVLPARRPRAPLRLLVPAAAGASRSAV